MNPSPAPVPTLRNHVKNAAVFLLGETLLLVAAVGFVLAIPTPEAVHTTFERRVWAGLLGPVGGYLFNVEALWIQAVVGIACHVPHVLCWHFGCKSGRFWSRVPLLLLGAAASGALWGGAAIIYLNVYG